MIIYKLLNNQNLVSSLKGGDVGLLPTDTIYGLSCSAYDERAVSRIYDVKGRDKGIPLIVLISDISDLKKFRIELTKEQVNLLTANWPGRISFILPLKIGFEYLTRGTATLAFRMPADGKLRSLLQKTGPLVSTSANPTGLPPAKNVDKAMAYFLDTLDFYVDTGNLVCGPSTLVDLSGTRPVVLRQGETAFSTPSN